MTTVNIPIGRNVYNDSIVYFPARTGRHQFGVTTIAASARFGKSSLVKILTTKIVEHDLLKKNCLILDYRGEHKGMKYVNFNSRDDMKAINGLNVVEDFGFYISDFDRVEDYLSMGYTYKGARKVMKLALNILEHQNDPFVFRDIVNKTFHNDKTLHVETTKNIINTTDYLVDSGFFLEPEDEVNFKKVHIDHWGKYLLQHPKTLINFNLSDLDVFKAQAYCGKILQQLASDYKKGLPYLALLKPLIIVEESSKLCPSVANEYERSSSGKWLCEYVIKLQRYDPNLIFITQDMELIDKLILENTQTFIFGQVSLPSWFEWKNVERLKKSIAGLKWNIDKNYREFVMTSKGNPYNQTFKVEDCCCHC